MLSSLLLLPSLLLSLSLLLLSGVGYYVVWKMNFYDSACVHAQHLSGTNFVVLLDCNDRAIVCLS